MRKLILSAFLAFGSLVLVGQVPVGGSMWQQQNSLRMLFGVTGGGSTVVFEPEYEVLLAYWDSLGIALPSAGLQRKQNTLLAAMKTGGAWDRLEVVYVFAQGGTSTADSLRALTNWKSLGTFTGVPFGGVTHGTFGYRCVVSGGINSNWSVSGSALASQNDVSISAWANSFYGSNRDLSLANEGTARQLLRMQNTNVLRLNSNTFGLNTALTGVLDSDKFFSASRTSSTDVIVHNGTNRQARTSTVSVIGLEETISAGASLRNSNFAAGAISFFSLGQEIDDEAPALYTALLTYINSL